MKTLQSIFANDAFQSSATADVRPFIADGCTFTADECADIADGGSLQRNPVRNGTKSLHEWKMFLARMRKNKLR